ncbi:P-loop NTPase family protein [Qiania dongpingensis]|uniref:ParA family protein n=1 Tax=Qiania dongpingensis TaxID=2763669 RepID=A0A7G9G175_9FIRM|nr:hypothetical protein [Qiania dongpingensis]QNM04557.1 hypothetical protein H9Q78_08725 [Qiania dongpingensis]
MEERRRRFGIYDREAEYTRRLGSYLRRRCGDMLEIKIFTRLETLESCLGDEMLDMALVGKEAAELCRNCRGLWFAVLTEEGGENGFSDDGTNIPQINKYQSAEQIWKQILKLEGGLFWEGERDQGYGNTVSFLGICSPVHGCGKTSLGLIMSRILAERKKVLFLTLDEFSSLPFLVGEERQEEAELSELFYYYSQKELTGARIQAAAGRWGQAEYIFPVKIPEDLYQDNMPYKTGFFLELAERGGYELAVLDLGEHAYGKEHLMRLCSRLFVPGRESPMDEMRINMFLEWLKKRGAGEHAVRCLIPAGPEDIRKYSLIKAFHGQMGSYVRELLDRYGYGQGVEG